MILALGIAGCVAAPAPETAAAAASPVTERPYFVRGMGYVVGLRDRGDSNGDAALVAVTGQVPAGARPGDRLSLQVAAVGSATSLRGGTLTATALSAAMDPSKRLGTVEGAVLTDPANPASGTVERGGVLETLPQ